MRHNPRCEAAQAQLAAFDAAWPAACKSCGGSGAWYHPGSYHTPPDGGPCSCVENGTCPLCGAGGLVLFEGGSADWSGCLVCGWDEQRATEQPGSFPTRPDFECGCWEDETQFTGDRP